MTASGKIGIWQIGECDWFIAESEDKAIEAAREMFGDHADVLIEEGEIKGLLDDDLDRLRYFIDDSGKRSISFRDRMLQMIYEGEKMNCIFASTEW